MKAKKNDYIQIEKVLLTSSQRANNIPEETKKHSYCMYVNGFLITEEACKGDIVQIKTRIGRILEGKLFDINPEFTHSFGPQIKDLLNIELEEKER